MSANALRAIKNRHKMKALIQRVTSASVSVEGKVVGSIERGLLVLLGVEKSDNERSAEQIAQKIINYRIFSDNDNKMNLSVADIKGGVLLVSQFTLAADTKKGLRPSFSLAADPARANALYEYCEAALKKQLNRVEVGIFAADMQVSLVNDGPVTFMLES